MKQIDVEVFNICDEKTKRKLKKISHKHQRDVHKKNISKKIEPIKKAIIKTCTDLKTSIISAFKDKLFWKLSFVVVLTIFILFNGFSWFYNEYVSKGTEIKVGSLEHLVKQYDANGNETGTLNDTSTLIYEKNMSNITKNTVYISIANIGSLNMEYNLTFNLDGTIENSGVMYYRIYDVTNEVNNSAITSSNDTKLKSYANTNPISSNIETDTGNPISNLSTINNLVVNGIINTSENTNDAIKYYRIDYGMYSATNTSLYSDSSVTLHYSVFSYQVGADMLASSEGEIWEVGNELQFRNAVTNSLSGDTIKLINDINIEGSVDIPKRIHLDTNNYKLNLTGDLVYDFVETGELNINASGKIDVLNNLYINAPKTKVKLTGNNSGYDIYVAGTVTLNGLQNEEQDGILLQQISIIKNKTGNIPADFYIMSNTRLTIDTNVYVGSVISYEGATNIEIINNGVIVQIDLQNMTLLDTFTKPQIYIYNLNVIEGTLGGSSIIIPSNATPYVGPNKGNTLIIRGMTSSDITVSGSDNFKTEDISSSDIEQNVIQLDGEDNSYKVYIRTSDATLEKLLTEYFENKNEEPTTSISNIKKLLIYTVNAQFLENEDFDFLRSSATTNLEYLDISNAKVIDNTVQNRIKSGALENKTSLKTVILPKTITEIGDSAFKNIELGKIPTTNDEEFSFLTIPNSVTSIGDSAFNASKYVSIETYVPPILGNNTFGTTTKLFVPSTSISLYQNIDSLNKLNIHQRAELSDNKNYFVYKTVGGVGISLFVPTTNIGEYLVIPNTVSLNSTQYTVNEIGDSAYALTSMNKEGTSLTLPTTIKKIQSYAFYNQPIKGATFDSVTFIGTYAFYNTLVEELIAPNLTQIDSYAFANSNLKNVKLTNAHTIGDSSFINNETLYEIDLGTVKDLGKKALYNCPLLGIVYFRNTDTRLIYSGETLDMTLGLESVFGSWGQYLDGRLRVYVPDGISDNGTSYLKLYRNLLGVNTDYIYVTGERIGDFSLPAMDHNFNRYSVRTVSKYNQDGVVVGLEIIEYHGEDLTSDYEIPEELTLSTGVTLPVISIGENAYKHVLVKEGETLTLDTNNIINIGESAFYGLKMTSIVAPNVYNIGSYAFTNTGLTSAEFPSLATLGDYALSNMPTLYSLNLGPVKVIGNNAVSNNPNLEQLFIVNTDLDNMQVSGNPFYNLGTNVNNRMRIYVPDGEIYTDFYKNLLGYESYIYGAGTIVGSYVNNPIPFNIGEYSVRKVTLKDYEGNEQTGYEIIEYHGADLTTTYNIPEEFTIEGVTLPVISIGKNAYIHTSTITGSSVNLISNSLINIGDNAFSGVKGITSFESNSLVTLNKYAFNNSTINKIETPNLNYIGTYALSDMNSLYYANLGVVKIMEQNALYKLDNLSQVFFRTTDTKLVFDQNAVNDVGSNTNGRIRFYVDDQGYDELTISATAKRSTGWGNYTYQYDVTVTNTSGKDINGWSLKLDGSAYGVSNVYAWGTNTTQVGDVYILSNVDYNTTLSNGQSVTFGMQITTTTENYDPQFFDCIGLFERQGVVIKPNYVDIYKALFSETYKNYFYAKGEIIGSYVQPNIPFDIGEYVVRKAIYTDYTNKKITGWEVVDYHGDEITEGYMLPETLTINNIRYDVIGIGDYAYRFAKVSDYESGTYDLTNNSIRYVGEHAFDGMKSLKVINSTSLETIGAYAFNDNVLYTVNAPNIINVDEYAFANNKTLNYVNLGNVSKLGNGVFYNDTGLLQLKFTRTVTLSDTNLIDITIGDNIFTNAGTDTKDRFRIYVPSGLSGELPYINLYKNKFEDVKNNIYQTGTIVGSYTYAGYPYDIGNYMIREVTLTNVSGESVTGYEIVDYHGPDIDNTYQIPSSFTVDGKTMNVISIGDNAYKYVKTLNDQNIDLVFPNRIISIGDNAFKERNIKSVTGYKISNIGSYAFSECSNLETVTFESTKKIGSYAFYNNEKMLSINLGDSTEYIGDYALYYPYSATKRSLYLDATIPPSLGTNPFPARSQNENNGTTYYLYSFWIYVPATSVSTYISTPIYSDYADSNSLGSGIHITSYSENGVYVYNIVNGNEIEIVSYNGNGTGTLELDESMTIGDNTYNVTTISSSAFAHASRLTGIVLPRYVYNVGDAFLEGNTSISSITVDSNNKYFKTIDNVLFDINGTTLVRYAPAKGGTSYNTPSTVKTIASSAFTNSNITSITFNSDLTVLSHNAFKNCTKLTSVTFTGTSVPYITGFNPFPNNNGLKINVPSESIDLYTSNSFLKGYTIN